MNYPPDRNKILGYLQKMREQIGELSGQEYNERNAFALNLLNKKLVDLEKALELLNYDVKPYVENHIEVNKMVSECFRPIKGKPDRIDHHIIDYYKKGIKGIQREIEGLIKLITSKGKNKAEALN